MKYNAVSGNGVTISVQSLPDRTSKYICVERDAVNVLHCIAPILSDEGDSRAELFITSLANLCGATMEIG